MKDQISSIDHTSFVEDETPCVHPTVFFKKHFSKTCCHLGNSRLDYCNSVLAGLPVEQTGRLQRVLNGAAWLVLKKCKQDHITPL